MFVDDLISGASNVKQAIIIQQQLVALLAKGGMQIRKWMSYDAAVLQSIPPELRERSDTLDLDNTASFPTLGIEWKPSSDVFTFSVQPSQHTIILDKFCWYWIQPDWINQQYHQNHWSASRENHHRLPFKPITHTHEKQLPTMTNFLSFAFLSTASTIRSKSVIALNSSFCSANLTDSGYSCIFNSRCFYSDKIYVKSNLMIS